MIGGVVGGTCYSTLAAAVQECPDGATVTVGGTVTVNAPIYFEKNVR
jgi:acyl CoA:acetate/3-ketoacid CoA transferase alpha subunit